MAANFKKNWDVFISHASEDRSEVALPLAEQLTHCGLRVWLDRFELKLGDSLREKIDYGLAESAFGVIIISPSFFRKDWPKRELDGLFAKEDFGSKVILPIWHGVDKAIVAQHSPLLAGKIAVNTKQGIFSIAQEIVRVVSEPSAIKLGAASLTAQFIGLLKQTVQAKSISSFLRAHPEVLQMAVGHFGLLRQVEWTCPNLEGFSGKYPDLVVGCLITTAGDWLWRYFFFGAIPDFDFQARTTATTLRHDVQSVHAVLKWATEHSQHDCRRSSETVEKVVVLPVGPDYLKATKNGRSAGMTRCNRSGIQKGKSSVLTGLVRAALCRMDSSN